MKGLRLGYNADGAHDAEVDGDSLLPSLDAVLRKSILKGTSGGIVRLADIANNTGDGREHDEKVEILWEARVEIPRGRDFGTDGVVPLRMGHVIEDRILFSMSATGFFGRFLCVSYSMMEYSHLAPWLR